MGATLGIAVMNVFVVNSRSSSLKYALFDLAEDTAQFGTPYYTRIDAPANDEPIGGLKVVTRSGWFAARPSGTENICKIYAESFTSQGHLDAILAEARHIVADTLSSGRARA